MCSLTLGRCLLRVSATAASSTRLASASSNADAAMDRSDVLSDRSRRREPSVLRELTKKVVSAPKGTISFATGMPNPETFPFAQLKISLKDGKEITVEGDELKSALQYQPSTGYIPLIKLLQEMQDQEHGIQDWESKSILISTGSNDGISRAIDMLLNVGDPLIVQHPMYSGMETLLKPYAPKYILAEQDNYGVNPKDLHQVLEDYKNLGKQMPKVMYLNPTGSNPTGTTLSTERKKELYKLAQEYNLIILEDDAYFHLHFLEANPVSFMSMDTDSRVIRFDSFSKILSSGLRLGVVTGPQKLLRQIELDVQGGTLQTSSMTQVMAYKLLKAWGRERLQEHYTQVQNFYKDRRDIMVGAAEKHLKGLAEWTVPSAGMFLWIKIKNVSDTYDMVMTRGTSKQIMLVPGRCFNAESDKPSPYVRAAFSLASEEEIHQGMIRLADLIREEQKLSVLKLKSK